MIVIVSGFAGCGKSTLAINLGKELGLQVIHASGILKELQNKKIEQIDAKRAQRGKGFWESEQGIGFVHQRIKDTSMDKALDKKLLEIIDKDNAVIDSKTMGYLSKKGIKIWVQCSAETRAERIAERDGLPKQEVLEKIVERDRGDTIIY